MSLPRFYVADEGGANQVLLVGIESPYPWPEPVYTSRYSEHTMSPGDAAPGETIIQDFGADPLGTLQVVVPKVTRATLDDLYAKYRAWSSGARPPVEVGYVGGLRWLASWRNLVATRRTKRIEGYRLEMDFRIEEEL